MNILLTGAGGFIGSHLHKELNTKHKVFQVFHPSDYIEGQNSFSVTLTNVSAVNKLIIDLSKQAKIDVIIHLASGIASPEKVDDVELLKESIVITENIVNITKSVKPRVLINFSSMAVYPNVSGIFSEESIPAPQKNPDCIYGLSKYCSEVMIDFLLRNENVRIVHLRISQVHGEDMRGAFHKDATIFGYVGEDLFAGPIELLFSWNDENGPAAELVYEIDHVDIEGTVATARLDINNWHGHRFTDLFTLLKTGGEWKIISKVFHLHDE